MTEVKYSAHAVERMIQRHISPREVENILMEPDCIIRQSKDKIIAYKKIKGRKDNSLAVVVVEMNGGQEVVTAMVNFEV